MEKSQAKLIRFLSLWDKWQSPETLFISIDHFLTESQINGRSFLFSLPRSLEMIKKKTIEQSIRVIWNKTIYEMERRNFFDIEELDLVQKISIVKKKDYVLLFLGYQHEQMLIGVIQANIPILDQYEDDFLRYIRDGMLQMQRWQDVDHYVEMAHRDDVTGLYNQRKLIKDLTFYIRKNTLTSENFCVLFIDIDYFKKVNDSYGHLIGTNLLVQLGNLLKGTMRENDLAYRYGGDEFVMLLPNVSRDMGRKVGERILSKVKNSRFSFKNEITIPMSVSIGVAEFPSDAKTSEEIVEIADQMMYQAKNFGRGRVCTVNDMFQAKGNESGEV